MFKAKQNLFLYLGIAVLPLFLLTVLFALHLSNKESSQQHKRAEWVGSIHNQYIEQVINETRNNMVILALSGASLNPDLLIKAKKTDPRYAGMFVLNNQGKSIMGTNESFNNKILMDKNLLETGLKTKKTIVSNKKESEGDKYTFFTISTPILNKEGQVAGFLMAQLRIDYMANVMRILTPDHTVKIANKQGGPLLVINQSGRSEITHWVKIPVDEVSWNIYVGLPENYKLLDYKSLATFFIFGLIISHIIFLAVKYILLRRESKRQKQLIETQKLEIVGTLAASAAHEIKNPLTGIKGLIQLLEEKSSDSKDQLYFSVIREEIERINGIVSEFLILGKPTVQTLSSLDIRLVLDELNPILESEARLYNVTLLVTLPVEPVYVLCSRDQLKQVILNIAKNAFESMAPGGQLAMELFQTDEQAKIEIVDTGVGMTASQIKKAFKPFYTSKNAGTGLGLFICKRILQMFDGSIHVSSKKNRGTKVTISMPINETTNAESEAD
jgi:two-component system, sporulation sensor kinase D